MSLTVTLPSNVDSPSLTRELAAAFPAELGGGVIYNVAGNQLSLESLFEADRVKAEGVLSAHAARQTERQQIINAYSANQTFAALSAPTTAQAVAQVKALTLQLNFIAEALFRKGII